METPRLLENHCNSLGLPKYGVLFNHKKFQTCNNNNLLYTISDARYNKKITLFSLMVCLHVDYLNMSFDTDEVHLLDKTCTKQVRVCVDESM